MFKVILLLMCLNGQVWMGSTRQGDLNEAGHHADASTHDVRYDQEAFLGHEEVGEFRKLTNEESKERLRKLVENRVDTNKDNIINETELKSWIQYVSNKWVTDERDRSWAEYNPSNKLLLSFDEYANINYGDRRDERYKGEDLKRVLKDIELDKQKWQFADDNGDGTFNKEEFLAFVRPEEVPKMKPFLIDEMLARTDKNKDGYIDIDEYTDELYAREPGVVRGTDPEPEWISNELKHFSVHRDRNADGRMDRKEVGEWLMPEEYDGAAAETHHLIAHADSNKDGVLSVEEVVAHNDLFAGSQATNYGATLEKDEL